MRISLPTDLSAGSGFLFDSQEHKSITAARPRRILTDFPMRLWSEGK